VLPRVTPDLSVGAVGRTAPPAALHSRPRRRPRSTAISDREHASCPPPRPRRSRPVRPPRPSPPR
jgi:hypothetical protein